MKSVYFIVATIAAVVFGMLYFLDPLEKLETVEIPGEVKVVTKTVTTKPDTVIRTEYVYRSLDFSDFPNIPNHSPEFYLIESPKETLYIDFPIYIAAILEETGNSYFTSRKTIDEDYLHFELFAYGLLPADSLGINYEINYDDYFNEHYRPLYDVQFRALRKRERRKLFMWSGIALVAGAYLWERAR